MRVLRQRLAFAHDQAAAAPSVAADAACRDVTAEGEQPDISEEAELRSMADVLETKAKGCKEAVGLSLGAKIEMMEALRSRMRRRSLSWRACCWHRCRPSMNSMPRTAPSPNCVQNKLTDAISMVVPGYGQG